MVQEWEGKYCVGGGGGMTALHMNWKNSKTKANGPIEREGERCILRASS